MSKKFESGAQKRQKKRLFELAARFSDNSAQDNSARRIRRRTIRRGQFGAGQFGADNSAQSIYYKFYGKSRFHSAIFFSSIPLPFQQSFINPASISAIFFINSYP